MKDIVSPNVIVSLKPLLPPWTMRHMSTALQTTANLIFPPQHARIPITPQNVLPFALPPLTLYVLLCYLVRRPNTRFIRLALAPIVAPWLWWLTFGVAWFPERTMAYNVPFTTTGVLFFLRAVEYSLSPNGRLKIGETYPGSSSPPPSTSTLAQIQHGLATANDLILSHRGIGWDFGTGQGLRLPPLQFRRLASTASTGPDDLSTPRAKWLLQTLVYDVLLNYLIVDIVNASWRTFLPELTDPARTPHVWDDLLSPAMKVVVPASVMLVVRCYMSMWYSLAAVLDVWLCEGRDFRDWPVLYGEPWKAESLHALWALEWHQLSRHTFLATLGYPLRALFGTPGLMLGAFLASGLYHNLMLIGDGQRTLSLPTNTFFLLQALGLILERLFRQLTGRKVRGFVGTAWTLAWAVLTVRPMAREWVQRGYLETSPVPREWSLVERVVGLIL